MSEKCCGASYLPEKIKKILSVKLFNEFCCIHDLNYTTGGTEEDRKQADIIFYESMLYETAFISNVFKRKYYESLAYLYYQAVRKLGKSSFNYTNKNQK